jgi:hypothetical protein
MMHIADLEKKNHFSDVLLLSPQENSPIHYLKTKQKHYITFCKKKQVGSIMTIISTASTATKARVSHL